MQSGKRYEFALAQGDQVQHYYYEAFRHSDHLIRLNTQLPGTGLDLLLPRSPNHLDLIVIRYKELWGDQGSQSDVLSVSGTNVINAATSPLSNRTNAMFVIDRGSDGVSDVSMPLEPFFSIRSSARWTCTCRRPRRRPGSCGSTSSHGGSGRFAC